MANEFRHGTVGTELTQAEYEAITGHAFDSQATGDLLYASSATQLSRLAIAAADTQYLTKAGGIPAWGASGQIVFPAAQNASTNANTLDDYEEGDVTFGVTFGGNAVGMTFDIRAGRYVKIGAQCMVWGRISLTAKGTSVGAARVTGLPFTIKSGNANSPPPTLRLATITYANAFMGWGGSNTTTIDLEEVTEAGVVTSLTDVDFANTSDIVISLAYEVA